MFGIGGWEMLVIGVIALLIFGPQRLPELARSLGKGLAEFRRASSDLRRSIDLAADETKLSAPDPATQPPAQAGSPAVAEKPGEQEPQATAKPGAFEPPEGASPVPPPASPSKEADTKEADTKAAAAEPEPVASGTKPSEGAGG